MSADEQDGDGDGFSTCDGDPDDSDPSALPYNPWSIGGTTSEWGSSNYFRGNMFTATEDTMLGWFEVYLGLSDTCELDFYVHSDTDERSLLWSGIITAGPGVGYYTSPEIGLAITAAEMGYLVFATLHTNSAAKTIDRIIDVFPEDQQAQVRTMLSASLKGVIAQLLIPRSDGKGRAVVNELLFPTVSLPNIIREGAIHKIVSLIEGGRGSGMQLMDDSILQRLKEGAISAENAYRWAADKKRFQPMLDRAKAK